MEILYAELVSYIFMFILLAWSIVWIVYSLYKLRSEPKDHIYWKAHIAWNVVNACIAVYSLYATYDTAIFNASEVEKLRNIVAINIVLDGVYIAGAALLKRSGSEKLLLVGKAVAIQGYFLFMLDTVIVVTLQILL